ncbi:MAG: endonuclease/exonuclease/phosphatase family protein [Longimicrobiales bacterium]
MRIGLLPLLFVSLAACSRLEPMLPPGESCKRTHVAEGELLPQRVVWKDARDTAEQRVLELWCETVGAAVYHPLPLGGDTGAVAIDSIALVSWNTHVGGADIERFVRDLRNGRFTNGRPVPHFVLLLQEVFRADSALPARTRITVPDRIAEDPPGPGTRRDIVQTAAILGLALLYVPSMRNGTSAAGNVPEDRGNAILSSLDLEDVRALELPFEVQRRVAAIAEIDTETISGDDFDLVLVSVHLDTRSRLRSLPASVGRGRRRQAAALIEDTRQDDAIVAGGDFNTWAPGFFEVALPFLRSAFPQTPAAPEAHTFQARAIRRRLDYLFFRLPDNMSATYQRIDAQYGSDHYPLIGWIQSR